jgi:hypothetical protein
MGRERERENREVYVMLRYGESGRRVTKAERERERERLGGTISVHPLF